MRKRLNIALLEPYYGGSHRLFCDTIVERSRHNITLVTLPARKWKWRMRAASVWFARDESDWARGAEGRGVDVVLCNDMLSVADLRALLPRGRRDVPIACYFHENQLTYPLPPDHIRDFQYGMTNITSCIAADAVWFNSAFHRDDFLTGARDLLGKMPDFVPSGVVAEIAAKSQVLPPPVSLDGGGDRSARSAGSVNDPITILWCHRWEYDKNPEPFFDALATLDAEKLPFQLVFLGEQFRTAPPVFAKTYDRLKPRIVHHGFVECRTEYETMLRACDVVVSTAIQENFGIAVAEAILAGCQPLLPNRLAYPELIPSIDWDRCLYDREEDLSDRLREIIDGRGRLTSVERARVHTHLASLWGTATERIDDALSDMIGK